MKYYYFRIRAPSACTHRIRKAIVSDKKAYMSSNLWCNSRTRNFWINCVCSCAIINRMLVHKWYCCLSSSANYNSVMTFYHKFFHLYKISKSYRIEPFATNDILKQVNIVFFFRLTVSPTLHQFRWILIFNLLVWTFRSNVCWKFNLRGFKVFLSSFQLSYYRH